jgi:non-ribosomal peptide synthetase component F
LPLLAGLRRVAHNESATLFMALLAAYQIVLSRWSGQHDIVVGAPIAARRQRELERLIGFFTNIVALRVDLSGNPRIREILGRVREAALEAYMHQDVPFERTAEALQPGRDVSRHRIFRVAINLTKLHPTPPVFSGIGVAPFGVTRNTSERDLTLYCGVAREGIHCELAFAKDLFSEARIEEFSRQYLRVLEQLVENKETRLNEIVLSPINGSPESDQSSGR